jgi:phosphoglycerol transferase
LQLNRPAYLLSIVAGLALVSCGDRGDIASSAKSSAPPAAPVASVPAYHATLEEGIAFTRPGYPDFVAKVEGISIAEPFGHWTDGPVAAIEFKEPLPKQFDLVLLGAAYGPNIGQPVKVTIGSASQSVVFDADLTNGAQTRRLAFNLDTPAKRIEFLIPHPTQPSNGDVRKLGIAMVDLKIEAPK